MAKVSNYARTRIELLHKQGLCSVVTSVNQTSTRSRVITDSPCSDYE